MSDNRAHSLIVGGSGMLRGVALRLAAKRGLVSVIARRADRLAELACEADAGPGRVEPIALDYADDEALRAALARSVRQNGPFCLVVAWIRPGAPKALETIAQCADAAAGEAATSPCRFYRVLGSAAADPAVRREGQGNRYRALEGLDYREIVLGFRIDGEGSRWNSNEEIAAGVIEAVERDLTDHVVGVVRPWEMNPHLRQQT